MSDVNLPIDGEIEEAAFTQDEGAVRRLWDEDARRGLFGMLRQARALQQQLDESARYLAMIVTEVADNDALKRQALLFLKEQIEVLGRDLLVGSSKHVDVPGAGRVQYRTRAESMRIIDEKAFMSALGADERALMVESVDVLRTNEAKAYAKATLEETGELLPGVARLPETTGVSITFSSPEMSSPHE